MFPDHPGLPVRLEKIAQEERETDDVGVNHSEDE